MVSDSYPRFLLFVLVLTVYSAPNALAGNSETESGEVHYKWALTLYGGPHAQETIGDVFSFQATFPDDTYIVAVGLSRELWRYKNWFALEVEGQVGKHFGEMDHWEFNGLLDIRWLPFPWDKYVETSLALGEGLSCATEIPEVELADYEEGQRLLNYLLFELTLGLPKYRRWDVVIPVHHRSGIFGLFGGVHGGANFVTGGIKYKF
jgi:hypothetical protein